VSLNLYDIAIEARLLAEEDGEEELRSWELGNLYTGLSLGAVCVGLQGVDRTVITFVGDLVWNSDFLPNKSCILQTFFNVITFETMFDVQLALIHSVRAPLTLSLHSF